MEKADINNTVIVPKHGTHGKVRVIKINILSSNLFMKLVSIGWLSFCCAGHRKITYCKFICHGQSPSLGVGGARPHQGH